MSLVSGLFAGGKYRNDPQWTSNLKSSISVGWPSDYTRLFSLQTFHRDLELLFQQSHTQTNLPLCSPFVARISHVPRILVTYPSNLRVALQWRCSSRLMPGDLENASNAQWECLNLRSAQWYQMNSSTLWRSLIFSISNSTAVDTQSTVACPSRLCTFKLDASCKLHAGQTLSESRRFSAFIKNSKTAEHLNGGVISFSQKQWPLARSMALLDTLFVELVVHVDIF